MAAVIGVCGTIVGVVLGFRLSSRRDRKAKDEKRVAIHEMLRTEIQHNLDQLKEWKASTPLPVQSHQIWQSQLEAVPSALKPEDVKKVHSFYYDLYGLRKLADAKSPDLEASIRKFLHEGNPLR